MGDLSPKLLPHPSIESLTVNCLSGQPECNQRLHSLTSVGGVNECYRDIYVNKQ